MGRSQVNRKPPEGRFLVGAVLASVIVHACSQADKQSSDPPQQEDANTFSDDLKRLHRTPAKSVQRSEARISFGYLEFEATPPDAMPPAADADPHGEAPSAASNDEVLL